MTVAFQQPGGILYTSIRKILLQICNLEKILSEINSLILQREIGCTSENVYGTPVIFETTFPKC